AGRGRGAVRLCFDPEKSQPAMTIRGYFQRLLHQFRRRQMTHVENFRELAHRIANGAEPPIEAIEETLARCGKTIDDLNQAVQAINARLKLRARVDRGTSAKVELERVKSEIA